MALPNLGTTGQFSPQSHPHDPSQARKQRAGSQPTTWPSACLWHGGTTSPNAVSNQERKCPALPEAGDYNLEALGIRKASWRLSQSLSIGRVGRAVPSHLFPSCSTPMPRPLQILSVFTTCSSGVVDQTYARNGDCSCSHEPRRCSLPFSFF